MSSPTPPSFRPSTATVVAVVAATTVAQVASVMGNAIFPVVAPRLAEELGVPAVFVGYQMSLIYGTGALATLFLSGMIPRFGACRMTQASLAFCAGALAIALTGELAALVAASVLLGIGMSVMTPSSAHLLFRFSPPDRRNLIFSLKQTGVPLGWVVVALTAPSITLAFGWRWALVAVAAVSAATLVAFEPVRGAWDDDRRRDAPVFSNPLRGLAVLWRRPALRWLSIASFFYAFLQLCLSSFTVTLLVTEAGYSLVEAGVLLSVTQASGVGGRILWGWRADRTGNGFGLLVRLNVLMIACCLVAAFLGPEWPRLAVAALFAVFGATAIGWNGIFLAEIARRSPPAEVGVATGGAMVWNFGGILVGPALFAVAYGVFGSYTLTFGALACVPVAGLAAILFGAAAAKR